VLHEQVGQCIVPGFQLDVEQEIRMVLSEEFVHEGPRQQLGQLRGEEAYQVLGQMFAQEGVGGSWITQHSLEERIVNVHRFRH
jgi:hypothetical protein